jgi:hypothetical protein
LLCSAPSFNARAIEWIIRIKEIVMSDEKVGSLTQDELLAELHRRGYDDVTERQIAEWRRRELLPPFDVKGGGRGRSRGRARSLWSDGKLVFDQTLKVRELLQIYGNVESVRLPLFVLGYSVPLRHVRAVLGEPLNELAQGIAEAVENEARAGGEIEDLIEEAASHNVEELRCAGAEVLLIPQHSLEAFLNVFVNEEYDLDDGAFELGAEELEAYESAMLERCSAALAAEGLGDIALARQDSSLLSFFDRAPFIKKYLSVHQLKLAIDECTDEDLLAIQRDLSYLREMALLAHRIIMTLTSQMPKEYRLAMADILRPVLSIGGLLVLADLSLRRYGFGPAIDYFLPAALQEFREGITDEVERELVEASKLIPEAMETYGPVLLNLFIQESQTGQGQ